MADVPDQLVFWCVEDVMQGDGQLDHAEARPEMPTGYRDSTNGLGAKFVSNLLQVPRIDMPQIGRGLDGIRAVDAPA